jgi:hypothetical protein
MKGASSGHGLRCFLLGRSSEFTRVFLARRAPLGRTVPERSPSTALTQIGGVPTDLDAEPVTADTVLPEIECAPLPITRSHLCFPYRIWNRRESPFPAIRSLNSLTAAEKQSHYFPVVA